MRRDDAQILEEMERQHKLGDLVRRTLRAISMGRIDQAENYAGQAQELAPDTTTVEELLGDLAMAKGHYEDAREHYERALEIEPINEDAEEKLGEAVIKIREGTDVIERMEDAVENPDEYRGFHKNPVIAAIYSIIPGAGQLYNQQYEKGLAMAAGAILLFAWALSEIVAYTGASMIAGARNSRLATEQAQQVMEGYGPLMWTLITLAIVAYLAILAYSIWDAYHTCARMKKEADEFGVEVVSEG